MRFTQSHLPGTIRKKGERSRDKRNRKMDYLENKMNICRVVLPSLCIITLIICVIVYVFTRPKQ